MFQEFGDSLTSLKLVLTICIMFLPQVENSKTKAAKGMTTSYIFEQACTMVGGEANLRQAVARGAVVCHREAGMELFSFPSKQTSQKDVVKQVVVSNASGAVGAEEHNEIKA